MPFIRTIAPDEATGQLEQIYDAAVRRAGRVFNILRLQSLNPAVLEAGIRLYQAIMFGPSSLTRTEREMIATVVSRTSGCFY